MSDTEQAGYTADEIMDVVDPCGVVRAKVDAKAVAPALTGTALPALLKQIKAITTVYPLRSVSKSRMLELVMMAASAQTLLTAEKATLTAERDWYRAALYGISQGYHADPAGYAAGALAWVGGDNAVDRLVRVNSALVAAASAIIRNARRVDKEGIAYCRHCGYLWGSHDECVVPALEANLALAKGESE